MNPAAAAAVPPPYTAGEEVANVATHGVGAIASGAGLAILLVYSAWFGDVRQVVSTAIFGATLILLYTASTIYHAVPSPRARHVAKIFDHASIYLLIAGTYTPFTLLALRGAWGWALFAAVWSLALAGVAMEAFWVYRPRWISAVVYLAMGWMVVLAGRRLVEALPPGAFPLLVAGGLLYSLGTIFYVMKRVKYAHAVWHGFVLGGSTCHFLAVVLLVLPVTR
ncbi:MAG: hemolysin III family protein [Deltaproteobacteria bacterium]|nr:hemolysin III family protein [Deltaproteobacteria bacterium]